MRGPRAIDIALDVVRMPRLARVLAHRPLPTDILDVIRLAGSDEACRAMGASMRRPPHLLRDAARFYLQQVMLHPEADRFRVLGLPWGATRAEARVHLRWLLMWLHPDRGGEWEAPYAARVLAAWHALSAETAPQPPPQPETPAVAAGGGAPRVPWIQIPEAPARRMPRRRPGWLLALAVSAVLATVCDTALYRLAPSPGPGGMSAALPASSGQTEEPSTQMADAQPDGGMPTHARETPSQ